MRRTLRLYCKLLSIQIRSQMQYRASFWMDFLTTGILNVTYFLSLALVLERFGTIAGWGLGEIAYLTGMAETSFAIMDLVFSGFDPDRFSHLVQYGRFDQVLLRPVNLTVQVLGSSFVLRRLGRAFEGLVVLAIGLWLSPIEWTLAKALYIPLIFISLVVGMGALFVAGGTLTFWTVRPVEAVNILTYGGEEMISYPMNIYPGWIRYFFTFAVPLIFLNYYPALYIMGKPDPLGFPVIAPWLAPVAASWMMIAALRFWKYGVDHYQSTGT